MDSSSRQTAVCVPQKEFVTKTARAELTSLGRNALWNFTLVLQSRKLLKLYGLRELSWRHGSCATECPEDDGLPDVAVLGFPSFPELSWEWGLETDRDRQK